MKILLVLEHDNHALKQSNYHLLTAAMELQGNIDVLIIGNQCDSVVEQTKQLPHINTILLANATEYIHQLPENSAPLVVSIAKEYDYVMAISNTFGKNLLPRAAALLDVSLISDVIKVISSDTFVRPMYAGNALATLQCNEKIKFITIRATGFVATLPTEKKEVNIREIFQIIPNALSQFKSKELGQSVRPELTSARIVISGGRGLKSAENFKLLEAIADRLGAAVGASRAAVDAGFAPNDYQVGQTGKIVAPELYIAVGISGAIQHLAGIQDSKIIVAINNDADAPIFQVADYGLVGDLFSILQELQKEL